MRHTLRRWPQLGQRLRAGLVGVRWAGAPRLELEEGPAEGLATWRNQLVDPFRDPPFAVRWSPSEGGGRVAFRVHHALADGQAFYTVVQAFLRAAALAAAGREPAATRSGTPEHPFGVLSLLRGRRAKLAAMWRTLRWLQREGQRGDATRLAIRSAGPGAVRVDVYRLAPAELAVFAVRARAYEVTASVCLAACWARALARFNAARCVDPGSKVSLEVPFSIRRGEATEVLGNLVSPLVFHGPGRAPLGVLARRFGEQLRRQRADRAHLAMPLFTAPGRWLPWPVFRRLAADDAWSGFASGHYTWLEDPEGLGRVVEEESAGALALRGYLMHPPVCRSMGASLVAFRSDDALSLYLATRATALDEAEARELGGYLRTELADVLEA
ncbi:MAG: hypothetical protein KDD82_14220 [Planctomycetes bacterium]|nr:hypothetical protein [Planctomycetota bacterium]